MFQGEHSAILSTFIKLPFSIKTFVSYISEWPLKTGLTCLKYIILLVHISTCICIIWNSITEGNKSIYLMKLTLYLCFKTDALYEESVCLACWFDLFNES